MGTQERLVIFDTTLRDGEQSPGASMIKAEKLRIAKALELLQVDVIEAGFPVASADDFAAVQEIAKCIKTCTVCALSRAVERDIKSAAEALHGGERTRIHTFIATSPVHMQTKLKMTPDQVFERAVSAVRLARNFTDEVEFSPEDAGRSEVGFLCRVISAVIDAGATIINIPDTVGYSVPEQFGTLIKELRARVPNSDRVVFSVHCHNDLGLAVANSLAAVSNGARQVECTINGLGERAGNASLEEIVMALRTRFDAFGLTTGIDTKRIVPTSRLVSNITGFPVQPNKAIVGANAFAHESGIHQDGVLKKRETYEIMRAQDVGWKENRIVLGKHSGRNALRTCLGGMGVSFEDEAQFAEIFARFKVLADRKHTIYDADLQALVSEIGFEQSFECYRLIALKVTSQTNVTPTAVIKLKIGDDEHEATSSGSGPVDATFKAIDSLVDSGSELLLYSVNNITTGTDSQGEVTVRLTRKGRIVNGLGSDTDIVIASARAYVNALNKLEGKVSGSALRANNI